MKYVTNRKSVVLRVGSGVVLYRSNKTGYAGWSEAMRWAMKSGYSASEVVVDMAGEE